MNEKLEAGERWQHVKRGTSYEVLGTALLQDAAGGGVHEGHPLVIYRGEDGMLWARGSNEFADGRFVRLATPTQDARERVKALEEALREIVARNRHRTWTATADNPEPHWEEGDGLFARIARTALGNQEERL